MTKIYVIGSLRQARVRDVAHDLRELGYEVFDDWHASGPEADSIWQNYETERGRTFREALNGDFAKHNFEFDKKHLEAADIGVLVFPAGNSAHIEAGYVAGLSKPVFFLMEKEPERWDVMYQFADAICYNTDELVEAIGVFDELVRIDAHTWTYP